MDRPTIVISVNTAWNIVNFRRSLLALLLARGCRVVAVAPPDGYEVQLIAMGVEFEPLAMDRKGTSPLADLMLFARYLRLLRRLRPAVFLGYTIKPNIYGSLAAHALGVPVINNISGLGTAFIKEGPVTRIVRGLYRAALRRSATVFFQNADDHALFASLGLVGAQARLVPGSGIDLHAFAPVPLPDADGAAPTFLLVARLLRDKGVGEFVEAARMLRRERPGLRFRLVGAIDPDNATAFTRADVERWQAEGVIEYPGRTDDVRAAIALADCVVLPSYREGLPRVLLEGGAMARPLVATDVPGCRDLVDDGVNGFLAQARDPASLADAMRKVADLSPDRRAAMGVASREKIARGFGEDTVLALYLDAIGRAARVRP